MYTVIEHTADVGIRVTGKDLEEFFTDATAGMFSLMLDAPADGLPARERVDLQAPCLSDLLVDWLNELLYLFERKKFIVEKVLFDIVEETRVQAVVLGTRFIGRLAGSEIKAATYHIIEKRPEGVYDATVYFDV